MKKLSLDLDQLAVDSFETVGDAARRAGTVRGHGFTDTTCAQRICDCPTGSGDTCDDMCNTGDCPTADFGCGSGFHTCQQPSCFYSCPSTCAAGDTCFC